MSTVHNTKRFERMFDELGTQVVRKIKKIIKTARNTKLSVSKGPEFVCSFRRSPEDGSLGVWYTCGCVNSMVWCVRVIIITLVTPKVTNSTSHMFFKKYGNHRFFY